MSDNPYESPEEGSFQNHRPTQLRHSALPVLLLLSIPTALFALVGTIVVCLFVGAAMGYSQEEIGGASAVLAMFVTVGAVTGVLLFGANMMSDHESR